jgi:hypothetical protein
LQSHCHPQRTNTRVTQGVNTLENHYDRAGCPLRTKSCNALVKWSDYDQGKGNDAMLDKQNHGEKEHLEERKDRHNKKNIETPYTQSQQCLYDATATPTADLLCRTDSLQESKQPHGNTQEGETGTVKTQLTLRRTDQRQPMVYSGQSKGTTCHRPWGSVCAGAHVSCATGEESVIVSVYESGITPV